MRVSVTCSRNGSTTVCSTPLKTNSTKPGPSPSPTTTVSFPASSHRSQSQAIAAAAVAWSWKPKQVMLAVTMVQGIKTMHRVLFVEGQRLRMRNAIPGYERWRCADADVHIHIHARTCTHMHMHAQTCASASSSSFYFFSFSKTFHFCGCCRRTASLALTGCSSTTMQQQPRLTRAATRTTRGHPRHTAVFACRRGTTACGPSGRAMARVHASDGEAQRVLLVQRTCTRSVTRSWRSLMTSAFSALVRCMPVSCVRVSA